MKEAQQREEEEAKKNGPHIDLTRFSIFEQSSYIKMKNDHYLS